MLPIINQKTVIPNFQFSSQKAHSTIQQTHRLVDQISAWLEIQLFCSTVFPDIAQAFSKKWHDGLLY